MPAISTKRALGLPAAITVARALASAAGALCMSDDIDVVLEASDAEVGRVLKAQVRHMRALIFPLRRGTTASREITREATISLPQQLDYGEDSLVERRQIRRATRKERHKLVRRRLLLTSAQLQEKLQLTRQAVSAATRAGRFFTVDVEGRSYYPAFLADGRVDRRVIEAISKSLGQLPGWTKWDFFMSPRGSLGDSTALEALFSGKVQLVEHVALAMLDEEAN